MKKGVLRVILWGITVALSVIVIFVKRERIIAQDFINADSYLITKPIKSNESYIWSFNTSNRNLSAIEIAFVYEEDEEKEYPALIEISCNENIVMKKEVNLLNCPNQSFWKLEIPQKIEEGENVIVRITNMSEEESDAEISLLYTNRRYRYLQNVGRYSINGIECEGQLISRYSYVVSYEYYKALTIVFGIILLSTVFDGGMCAFIQKLC